MARPATFLPAFNVAALDAWSCRFFAQPFLSFGIPGCVEGVRQILACRLRKELPRHVLRWLRGEVVSTLSTWIHANYTLLALLVSICFSFGEHHVTPRGLNADLLGTLVCVEGIVSKCKTPVRNACA
jgi:DNA replicative helicase MCM subunit Mcm2 (Cdc46/Mcm family)